MDDAERLSLEAIGRFVEASREIRFGHGAWIGYTTHP
jgi:hypothetical protein